MPSRLNSILMQGDGMGLFERMHLSDQNYSGLYCGPSRGLHSSDFMVSTIFCSSSPERGPLGNSGVDASLRRVLCRAD
jgi:hypothetical protein